ncbi:uncharacterized protein [Watersipora subatra]|uniref:uncharacterized protein n=1 Tax=Watersipora subatra TaxID=2589382 RepID=UPI00355C1D24
MRVDSESSDGSSVAPVCRVSRRSGQSRSKHPNFKLSRRDSSGSDRSYTFSPGWRGRQSYKKLSPRRYNSPARSCFGCNKEGHHVRDCSSVRCYVCSRKGHISKDCHRNKLSEKYESRRGSGKYSSGSSSSSRSPSGDRYNSGRQSRSFRKSPHRVRFTKSNDD